MDTNEILDFDLESDFRGIPVELISAKKFGILSFVTFGLYPIWWIYKMWKFFKEKDNLDVMPVMRAIFAIFFTIPLFERIQLFAKSKDYTQSYSSVGLFVLFLLLNFLSKLPDPYWMVSLFVFVSFIPPLNAFNFAISNSDQYEGVERAGFNTRQIVLLVVGGILIGLVILGLMMPVEETYY